MGAAFNDLPPIFLIASTYSVLIRLRCPPMMPRPASPPTSDPATSRAATAAARPPRDSTTPRQPRWRATPIACSRRFSNPVGGSASGASKPSASAVSDSSLMCARHLGPRSTCNSAPARSPPPRTPSASSGARSRTSAHPSALIIGRPSFGLTFRDECRAQPDHRGTDAGLRGPERDAFGVPDLAGGLSVEGGQDQGATLLGRKLRERGAKARDVLVHGRRVLGASSLRRHLEHEQRFRVDGHRAPQPYRVDREVAGDGEEPRRDGAAARVVCGGVAPGPQERLLSDVLGERGVTRDGDRKPEDPALEAPDERSRGLGVAGPEPGKKSVVRNRPHAGSTSPRLVRIGLDHLPHLAGHGSASRSVRLPTPAP